MNKKNIEKVVVSARISWDVDRLLQLFANKWGIDKSELIVEGIDKHVYKLLDKHGVPDGYYKNDEDDSSVSE